MPNWVYNTLTLHGDNDKLLEIANVLDERHPLDVKHWKQDRPDTEQSYPHRPISFTNLIAPPEDVWDDYVARCTADKFDGPNNWYNWNNRVWGTKWNACETSFELDGNTLTYTFETAWSQPSEDLMQAMADVIANAGVEMATWSYEEEQGWGGRYGYDCQYNRFDLEEFYDIPSSHADYERRDREGDCICSWESDTDIWYDDCPGKEEE